MSYDPALPYERVAAWGDIPGLVHGFFGRAGGWSRGPFASCNFSANVGDSVEAVHRNWHSLRNHLGSGRLVRMNQVHGARVNLVAAAPVAGPQLDDGDDGQPWECFGDCDGLVTGGRGIDLAVLTADCVPILLVAPTHGAAMALHAGWRGTVAGIAAAGLQVARRALGIEPHDWRAALGPAIGGCCYEVERAIGDDIADRWGAMPEAWQPSAGRGQLDLRRANAAILSRCGLPAEQITFIGPCTACAWDRYYSHRRSGGNTGRQVSVIGFRGDSLVVPPSCDG